MISNYTNTSEYKTHMNEALKEVFIVHEIKNKRKKLRTLDGNPSLLKFFNNDISR